MMFSQRRNRLTTHFSERVPLVNRRMTVSTRTAPGPTHFLNSPMASFKLLRFCAHNIRWAIQRLYLCNLFAVMSINIRWAIQRLYLCNLFAVMSINIRWAIQRLYLCNLFAVMSINIRWAIQRLYLCNLFAVMSINP